MTEGALPALAFPGSGLPSSVGPAGPTSARPRVEVRPGLAAASQPSQVSFPAPSPRLLPSERVLAQQSAALPAGSGQPASFGGTEARATVPGHRSRPSWVSSAPQASLPSRPSFPESSPTFPRARSGQGKGSAASPRKPRRRDGLQRPSSRHLVWRRSRRAPPCGEAGEEGGRRRRRRRAREGAEERSQRSPAATSGAPTHRAATEVAQGGSGGGGAGAGGAAGAGRRA